MSKKKGESDYEASENEDLEFGAPAATSRQLDMLRKVQAEEGSRRVGGKSKRDSEEKERDREKCYMCQRDAKANDNIVYCEQCDWG
jgi:hypothetical protein